MANQRSQDDPLNSAMDRVTFRAPTALVDDVELLVRMGYYATASEAWRQAGTTLRERHSDVLEARTRRLNDRIDRLEAIIQGTDGLELPEGAEER